MMETKGYPYRSCIQWILAFVDCFLIIVGMFMAGILRFGREYYYVASIYSIWKMMVFVLVVQMSFYFFDLYDLINLRGGRKIAVLLLESVGISFLLLAILYYSAPSLAIGRGILSLSLLVIFALAFFWRFILGHLCRKILRERILIVGTGELSQKIAGDVYEHGQDSFEIVGFVEERRGATQRSDESSDRWRL